MTSVLKPYELDLDISSGKLIYAPMSNFGYRTIPEGLCMYIPEFQEMMLYREIIIEGRLVIDGNLAFVE